MCKVALIRGAFCVGAYGQYSLVPLVAILRLMGQL